jgi:hypothetical protein
MIRYIAALGSMLLISGIAIGDELSAGWALYENGEYDQAYDLFSKAFRSDPSSVDSNFALAEAAFKRRKYSHAVFAYDRVLMVQPDHEKALLGKASALMALGQPEEAREAYNLVLDGTADAAVQGFVRDSIRQIDQSTRELVLKGRVHLSFIYDDNVNYGGDDLTVFEPTESKETVGMEGGLDLRAEYDVGRKDGWLLVGGLALFDSWYDVAEDHEVANIRIHAGVRNVGKRNLVEVVGRGENLWYGGNPLVSIYGGDGAWMFVATKNHSFVTRATLESRNYDSDYDTGFISMSPMDDRDSVYVRLGEEWKYHFSNRQNNLTLGVDLLSENAKANKYSYLGYRVRLDGQAALPGGVITYAGGCYRFTKYDEPDMAGVYREDDRWDLLVGVKRRFVERVWLDLQYLHTWNTSSLPDYEFDRNRVSLSVIYEF